MMSPVISPWLRFYVFNLAWRSNKLWKCRPGHPEPPAKIQKAPSLLLLVPCSELLPKCDTSHPPGTQVWLPSDRVKMNVKLVHWFNTCMFLNIVSFWFIMFNFSFFQVPKRVPKTAKLPQKGALVKKPMYIKSYGTIRAGLCVDLKMVFANSRQPRPFQRHHQSKHHIPLPERKPGHNHYHGHHWNVPLDVASHAFYRVW